MSIVAKELQLLVSVHWYLRTIGIYFPVCQNSFRGEGCSALCYLRSRLSPCLSSLSIIGGRTSQAGRPNQDLKVVRFHANTKTATLHPTFLVPSPAAAILPPPS